MTTHEAIVSLQHVLAAHNLSDDPILTDALEHAIQRIHEIRPEDPTAEFLDKAHWGVRRQEFGDTV